MPLYNLINNCQKITVKIAIFLLFLLIFSFFPAYSSASVMESDNYKLESDEINMGAIGDMRDFSDYNERGSPVAGVSEGASVSAGLAGVLLFLFFVFIGVKLKRKS